MKTFPISLFDPAFVAGPMPFPNQGVCQSQKTAENGSKHGMVADFPSQELAANPNDQLGTFTTRGASKPRGMCEELDAMIGRLFGAWLGEKIAGKNEGAKGAILGYGAAAMAKRGLPALAALALGGWAFKKWRNKRRSNASYPPEATPSPPSS